MILRTITFALIFAAASILLARVHPFGDAGLYANVQSTPVSEQIPPTARAILAAKCADCHSSTTRTPIYGRVAPISWLLERDILEGRRHMNLSDWNTYSPDQQQTLISKIVREAKSHQMPLPQYTLIHRNARITEADTQALAAWAHAGPTIASDTQPTTPGDATRGAAVFDKRCTGCHSLTTSREGPKLQGIYGRPTAAIPDFPYSDSLKNAHLTWNDRTLEQWLADPDAFLPGNNMDFYVAKPQERKDLIAFFQQSAAR